MNGDNNELFEGIKWRFDGYFVEIVKGLGRVNSNFKNRSYLGETHIQFILLFPVSC